jgi:hypothetical protein
MTPRLGVRLHANAWGDHHGKFLCDAFFGTGKRLVAYNLNLIGSEEPFDRKFVYKVFGKIKHTCVVILRPNFGDFAISAKPQSFIGGLGISNYCGFRFPETLGTVECAVTSNLLDTNSVVSVLSPPTAKPER